MSKLGKSNDAPEALGAGLPFETAIQRLETIVDSMEAGDLPLESLLAKFEEGTQLARVCQSKLAEAELKVQQLEKNLAGDFKLKTTSADETDEP
jgi:exodeoxyribonuclease VII small subunit